MNAKKLMNFALTVGELMLKSGAETYRVEDTINRILKTSNYTGIHSFVTPTGLFATINDDNDDHEPLTYIRRIDAREIHLSKIESANRISRDYCNHLIDLEEAFSLIRSVQKEKFYHPLIMVPSIGLAAGLFSIVLGGSIDDGIVTLVSGLILALLQQFLSLYTLPKFFMDLIGSFIATMVSLLIYHIVGYGSHLDLIIISSIMPLVPGVAITNAVRDTLNGDLVSGSARILDAFIVAASIATGVGIAISSLQGLIGGII